MGNNWLNKIKHDLPDHNRQPSGVYEAALSVSVVKCRVFAFWIGYKWSFLSLGAS
jgi:hypothetical protein